MIRAKLRCMNKTINWNGQVDFRFMPVLGGTPENEDFYKYTPAGEVTMAFQGEPAAAGTPELVPGQFYYFDFEQHRDGDHKVHTVELKEEGMSIGLGSAGNRTGKPEVGAMLYAAYTLSVVRNRVGRMFGNPGTLVNVVLSEAPGLDDE
jgi:hypothetical protein